jgi:hypothetical protein
MDCGCFPGRNARSALLGGIIMFNGYHDLSLRMPFFEITESSSRVT